MTPYWHDDHLTLYGGDCRDVLLELPAESVHCVVTSPPYWGLRDYGTATWEGGDADCDHLVGPLASAKSGLQGGNVKDTDKIRTNGMPFKGACGRCGATRIDSQLGLEPTPEEYVANMVAVFREVRRVLRADGTLWLNLGDTYNNADKWGGGGVNTGKHTKAPDGSVPSWSGVRRRWADLPGLKPKDLVGIPWRVAFALQADGWYLRSDVIWSKPNPMPESVTDRPTKAHEYLFLLSKSPRYYFDAEAVREEPAGYERKGGTATYTADGFTTNGVGSKTLHQMSDAGRNLRSVWTIATEPYPGAHFATFPRKLVEPCVKAGASERGVCPECGAPWERVVERKRVEPIDYDGKNLTQDPQHSARRMLANVRARRAAGEAHDQPFPPPVTTGWRPTCDHSRVTGRIRNPGEAEQVKMRPPDPVPATVLDPFAGSGTTLLVAQALGRRAVGIDLNPEYLRQALKRNAQTPLGLVG